jgi:hypothetical protein
VNRFLACFIATRSGIITSISSTGPCRADFIQNGTLPYQIRSPPSEAHPLHAAASRRRRAPEIRSFGARLESRELSAQDRLTSEQLRTL